MGHCNILHYFIQASSGLVFCFKPIDTWWKNKYQISPGGGSEGHDLRRLKEVARLDMNELFGSWMTKEITGSFDEHENCY